MRQRRIVMCLGSMALLGFVGAAFFYRPTASSMTLAAQAFLESLPAEKRAMAQMRFADPARLDWHFIPKDQRKGLQIKDMSEGQRKLAHAVLASALSELGHDKARQIMSLEAILRELEKSRQGAPLRDDERYYMTVFGDPQLSGEWGLSFEGHHLSLNFVVKDGRVASASPAFYGANPATVQSDVGVGPKRGTRVLKDEEVLAFDLLAALTSEQKSKAVIAEKAPNDLRAAGEPTPPQTQPEGLGAGDMTTEQRSILEKLIHAYTDNMAPEVAQERLKEVQEGGMENIHFAWAGADKPGVGHYYRVQGPTFVIELVNTQPDSAGNPANHIHSVWRQMNGDFGVEN